MNITHKCKKKKKTFGKDQFPLKDDTVREDFKPANLHGLLENDILLYR